MVFPPSDVLEGRNWTASQKGAYTLPPGTHEYPWKFKVGVTQSKTVQVLTIPASYRLTMHATLRRA